MTRQINETKNPSQSFRQMLSGQDTGLGGSALTPSGAEMSDMEGEFPLMTTAGWGGMREIWGWSEVLCAVLFANCKGCLPLAAAASRSLGRFPAPPVAHCHFWGKAWSLQPSAGDKLQLCPGVPQNFSLCAMSHSPQPDSRPLKTSV